MPIFEAASGLGSAASASYSQFAPSSLADRRPAFQAPPPQARAEPAAAPAPEGTSFPLGVARGQVARTYIVAEAEDGLVIVDQHAAHERLTLERMRRAMEGQGVASQALLRPEVVWDDLVQGTLWSVLYTLVFVGLAFWMFRRKDVLS